MAIVELDEQGKSLWQAVTEAWDDQGNHDRFVQHCFSQSRLAAAAACYRSHAAAHPGDPENPIDPIARRMQDRIVFLSMTPLVPSPGRQGGFRLLQSPWLVVIILVGAALGAFLGFVFGERR